jgi:catechol 2,3-dioxygenase-like lactoylglutathione lyase family enzyme
VKFQLVPSSGRLVPVPIMVPVGPAPHDARFRHVNLIADDWRRLADFYQRVFGCEPVPPERDYVGPDLERGTGVAGASLRGVHLRLPGWGTEGPTLEIYTYGENASGGARAANRTGWGHIALGVSDVPGARAAVLEAGGQSVGEVVTLQTADGRRVTWCYVTDPEGNIIELQSWD